MQTNRLTSKPTDEVIGAIQALDLTSVKTRLMDAELGEGWTQEYADSIEQAYKTYLTMLVKYQEHAEDIMLAKDVDEFWHTHILQTMKYMDDCERVFGGYLHHAPHIGEVTEADLEKRTALAAKTRRLYEQEFGIELTAGAWSGAAVKRQDAAWSGVAVKATDAAWSGLAVKGEKAAWSGVAVKTDNAAWSGAAVKADNAAWSGAAVRAENAAWSGAAVKAENAAWSGAAVKPENAAWSGAAVKAENAAWSGAAVKAENAAWSGAAIQSSPVSASESVDVTT